MDNEITMILSSTFDLTILGLIIAGHLILGSVILFRNPKSATNFLFFLVSISIVIWGIANYFSYSVRGENEVLILARLVLFFAVPFATLFFLLIHTFPSPKLTISRAWLRLLVALSAIAMAVSVSPLTFKEIIPSDTGVGVPIVGPGIFIFGFTVLLYDLGGILLLIGKIIRTVEEERIQQFYLLTGTILMRILILIFAFIFPTALNDTRFIPFAASFTFPFMAFTAYAILKHHLLNIKVIATEVLTFIVVVVTLLQLFYADTLTILIFDLILFILVLLFGILLIRSVVNEVEQREKLEALAKNLETANAELKRLDETKSEFISIASHQFRAPLTVIKGYISLMLENTSDELTKELRNLLNRLAVISQGLVRLVKDILELSRLETGKMQYEFVKNDFQKLADEVIEELRPAAEKLGVKISWTIKETDSISFIFDREKISMVLHELLDNAIRYSGTGEVALEETIIRNNTDNLLHLAVKDKGIGISEEDYPRIFTKFFRSELAKKINPLGLGTHLYLAKHIVKDHKGSIGVKSEGEKKGSIFFIELPLI